MQLKYLLVKQHFRQVSYKTCCSGEQYGTWTIFSIVARNKMIDQKKSFFRSNWILFLVYRKQTRKFLINQISAQISSIFAIILIVEKEVSSSIIECSLRIVRPLQRTCFQLTRIFWLAKLTWRTTAKMPQCHLCLSLIHQEKPV